MLTTKLQLQTITNLGRYRSLALIVLIVYVLAVFQDYLFATLKYTGFYLSESLLYNTNWLFYIPLLWITNMLYVKTKFTSLTHKVLQLGATSILFSGLHVLFFAGFFTSISTVVFDPPHRFSNTLNSALSNQLYISLIIYAFFPSILKVFNQKRSARELTKYAERINLKTHLGHRLVEVGTIQLLSSERPYTVIHTNEHQYYHDDSLKKLESLFDPAHFYRVHRSTIVNKIHVKELKSRKNGDFDALLTNGQSVRFSRHYRKNWSELLHQ